MPIWNQFLNPNFYVPLFFNVVRIGCILLFAYLCTVAVERMLRGLRKYVVKVMLKTGETEYELEKRIRTIGGVVRKGMAVVIWAIAAIMILKEMDFDIRPLLAGAGVIGVAIGFGAQGVVKDVLSGMLMLIENQIRVNDVAIINGKGGLVEEINLRTTVLRDEDGAVHIFPNGNIQTISNLTREYSYYVFNVAVAYETDTDQVIAVLKEVADQLMQEDPYKAAILAPLDVMGVDKITPDAVMVKARIKTVPIKQWLVGREMNRRIRKRFVDAEIEMPFPTQRIELAPHISPELRGELKQVVREVLKEGN